MDSLRLLTRGSNFKLNDKDTKTQHVPSAGPQSHLEGRDAASKKRKRTEYEDIEVRPLVGVDEIRKIHHQSKIKITDLRTLHATNPSESRKAQKHSARLYPQPLQHFSALKSYHTSPALISNLCDQGYKEPSEVQMATIPLLLEDKDEPDLLTIAPTGSGKTLAFMIPLINKIRRAHGSHALNSSDQHVSAIILAPTKELVLQIVNEGRKLAARTGVRITAFKKGMALHHEVTPAEGDDTDDSEPDISAKGILVKSDILVSTPLSLLHAITLEQSGDDSTSPDVQLLSLPNVTNLVLDEADVLLDTLFRDQTLSVWSALTNPCLRTSLWSATIGSNIEEIALSILKARYNQQTIQSPLLRVIIGLKDTSLPNITHKLIFSSTEQGKLTGLRNLIRPPPGSNSDKTSNSSKQQTGPLLRPPFLIFTQTIPRAQSLHEELKYDIPPSSLPDSPSRIAVLHSSLSATARSTIMTNFRLGKIWILITTDLLSRGIDFRGVNGVVNYDIPTTSASYVHRAGRTGRAGRQGGVCITFYTKDDVIYLRPIANVIKKSQKLHGTSSLPPQGTNGEAIIQNGKADGDNSGIPDWLLNSLPALSKHAKKELKERGVDVRRAVKESDDKYERRRKGRNLIGTKSGYEKKLENKRRGMVEGSKRRKEAAAAGERDRRYVGDDQNSDDDFDGFD